MFGLEVDDDDKPTHWLDLFIDQNRRGVHGGARGGGQGAEAAVPALLPQVSERVGWMDRRGCAMHFIYIHIYYK